MEFSGENNVEYTDLLQTLYLILSVRLSYYFHTFSDITARKWMSTLLGLVNVFVILNANAWHYFLAITFTVWMMTLIGPKYCHIVGFVTMFAYLVIYRLIYYVQGIVLGQLLIVIQSLATMMVVGIGFEINLAYKRKLDPKKEDKVDPTEENLLKIGFLDILHYVFNFATVCTGPYVRYQVYSDFIKLPFSRALRRGRVSSLQITIIAPLCLFLYCIFTEVWPIQYIFTDEFAGRSFMYRIHYGVLQWLRYRVFLYSTFGVIRCFSVLSGIGAYPVENKAIASYGATVNDNNLRKITFDEAKEMNLDMNTTQVVGDYYFEVLPTIRDATREWNKGIQYWLGVYIYKCLPKEVGQMGRIFLTLVTSWLWHGVYPSMLVACLICAYYYTVETFYIRLQRKMSGRVVTFMNVCFWISRHYYWSWAMMAYLLLDLEKTFNYYNSTYYVPLVFAIVMHILYICIFSRLVKSKNI